MSSILVVDRDPVFGAVVEDRLHVAGHDVERHLDPAQAVATTRAAHPDLLILELTGGVTEIETLRQAGATRTLPVLALSASAESSDRVAALRAGADDYLTKPCDLEELLLRVERLVGGRSRTPVLEGDLDEHPLWELVQYLQQADKSGDLVLRTPDGTGQLRLRQGRVHAAQWAKLPPAEALLAILGLKKGQFRFVSDDGGGTDAGEPLAFQELLMRTAWMEDELGKRHQHLPVAGMPLRLGEAEIPARDGDFESLPIDEVVARIRDRGEARLFDLIRDLPVAPQPIRLAVAWLVEQGALKIPETGQSFPDTHEITATALLDLTVGQLLQAARQAGFGTSALPFLVIAEDGAWPAMIQLLRRAPGFRHHPGLVGLVGQLEARRGGSVSFPHELGKLALHAQPLDAGTWSQVEAEITVSAGVLLWLDDAADLALLQRVVERLESVRGKTAGVIVAGGSHAMSVAAPLTVGSERWRISAHAPRSLIGLFRLLQPAAGG